MKKLSHQFDKPKRSVASPEALEALRNNNAVRWYVLSLPDCHRGGVRGLQREQDRRIQAGEPSFGFFAPSYQEVRRIDGKFVNTQRPLLFNYVFVRASERDVFQLMQRFPVLSFLPRVRERKREYFPYLSDAAMENLQWVARSYSNTLPVYIPQPDGLRKGDRIRITEGRFKGLDKDAKMKDSGVEWIGEIPEGWKVVRFKHIASIKSNLVQPDKYMKYPQIALDNIEKDTGRLLSHQTVEESGVISGNHLFYRGQILCSKIRPNLNKLTVAPFNGLCSADMYPIESKLPTLFMVYSMLSTYFVSQVSLIIQDRVKMPKINQEELGEIKVAVPSQQEMLTIADYLDSKCSEIDALLQNYEYQIATLEEYKKSLIYEYVTGKKEVPEA